MIRGKVVSSFIYLVVTLLSWVSIVVADDCKQLMVVGDINWPPYAMQEEKDDIDDEAVQEVSFNGLGIDLVKKIFAELDIPVHILHLDNRRNIFNALHLGDIDVVVNTYANKEIEEFADILKPGYFADPVAVYMHKDQVTEIKNWNDLIGKRGLTTENFLFGTKFAEYVHKYLYVQSKGMLVDVVDLLHKHKADYLIGSKLQLEKGIKQAGLQNELFLVPNVSNPEEIHMAYAKNSSCSIYLPYLRKRLLDLKKDGTINTMMLKYEK